MKYKQVTAPKNKKNLRKEGASYGLMVDGDKSPLTWLEGFDGDKSGHAAKKPGALPLVHLTEDSLYLV